MNTPSAAAGASEVAGPGASPQTAPDEPRPPGATPHRLRTVLQVAIGRLVPDSAERLPEWADAVQTAAQARRLARWLRRRCDLQLADAGTSLTTALASSAALLLAQFEEGWYLIECRQGAACLWSGVGDAPAPLSEIDETRVLRLLSVRPAQDLTTRAGTSAERQPLVLPFLREHRGRLIELALAGLLINAVGMLLPLFSMLVYDRIIGNGILETLWALAIGLCLFVLLELFLKAARTQAIESVTCRLDARVDRQLLERLLAQRGPMPPVGVMLARYRDLVSSRDFLSSTWLMALVDVPFAALYLLVVGVIGGSLVEVPLIIGLLMVGTQWLLHRPAMRYGEIATKAQTGKVNTLAETLAAGEVVRATPLRWTLSRRFAHLAEQASLAQARSRYWTNLGAHSTSTAVTLSWMSVLVVGVYQIEARALTVGGLVACSMLTSRAIGMLAGVSTMASRWGDLRRASRLMDELVADTDTRAPIDPGSAQWMSRVSTLSLRELSFDHDPARPLLDGLNLEVPPGEFVVLIGRPGSGKTTLLKLLGGLLRPSRGDAMLDGHSVLDWPLEFRARHIGFKPQEAVLFEGTLAENILGGAEAYVDRQRFAAALAVSGLDQWIAKGTLSLSQRVLPGGANLSGGQRQVIALARALVGGCPVLLLDEPTVGLDQATEAGIVARLRAWGRGRTIVVATHSMAMINAADRIVMIDGGRIVADGPRSKVLAGSAGAPAGAAAASTTAAAASTATTPIAAAPDAAAPDAAVSTAASAMPAAAMPAVPSVSAASTSIAQLSTMRAVATHTLGRTVPAMPSPAQSAEGAGGRASGPPTPPATPTPIAPFGRRAVSPGARRIAPALPGAGGGVPFGRDLSSMLRRFAGSPTPAGGAADTRAPVAESAPGDSSRPAAEREPVAVAGPVVAAAPAGTPEAVAAADPVAPPERADAANARPA
jgi:ATP-binding cassette subfamily B protein